MERFNALGRGLQIMLVGAVLLFIDLFLPWQDFDIGGLADEFGVDATFSGWRGVGAVLGILTIALVAWIVLRLAAVDLRLPFSTTLIAAVLGAAVLVFGVIKWITIVDDEATIWAWVGLALSILIAVGAWLTVQAAGGVEALRSEVSGTPGGDLSGGGPVVAEPPPPSAPAATAPPPEAAPVHPAPGTETAEPEQAPPEAAPEERPASEEQREREP